MYLLHIGSSELGFPARPEAGSPGFDLLKLPFREFEIDETMLAVRKMKQTLTLLSGLLALPKPSA
jgi:hypothetical protein